MKNVDCANCAAKMSENIKKIAGVQDANVNFLMQKLSLEVEDASKLDEIMPQVVKACKSVDPDCEVLM